MKQILQTLKTGDVEVVEVPVPSPRNGCLFIRTRASLVSAGTERMPVEFGRAGWIEKTRQQPEKENTLNYPSLRRLSCSTQEGGCLQDGYSYEDVGIHGLWPASNPGCGWTGSPGP